MSPVALEVAGLTKGYTKDGRRLPVLDLERLAVGQVWDLMRGESVAPRG